MIKLQKSLLTIQNLKWPNSCEKLIFVRFLTRAFLLSFYTITGCLFKQSRVFFFLQELSSNRFTEGYGVVPLTSFHKHFPHERPWPFQSLSLCMFLLLRPKHFEQQGLGE